MLIKYVEKVNTECRITQPILSTRAIKIDAHTNSLKKKVGCGALKSCDYLKKTKQKLYFIEISDFNAQYVDLMKKSTAQAARQSIQTEIRLKLSESLLIFNRICEVFVVHKEKIIQNKALLVLCSEKKSDVVAMAFMSRAMKKHYCPAHFASIQIVPYIEIDNIFQKR
jgi:glutaredoxin